ncbi:hypothetical protein N9854_06320 [Amylibacter sp.]|nr:hypothetical protein [Amylibacter sp.]MDB4251358.1 hypothetical protein [Amylibacter sp.]MDB9817307.1 hypothetical protein [Amylibacter sp.]
MQKLVSAAALGSYEGRWSGEISFAVVCAALNRLNAIALCPKPDIILLIAGSFR